MPKFNARIVRQQSIEMITEQWDRVAPVRDRQIRSGSDLSFDHVLKPSLLGLAENADWTRVIDVGCGTGALTEELCLRAGSVVGVDVSRCSIEIARASVQKEVNVQYVNESIELFAATVKMPTFSLAVANMFLQDAPDLDATLNAISSVLIHNGVFVCTITHPCFWPRYWSYDSAEWYNYEKEIAIEAPFLISSASESIGFTTHYHRPIGRYINAICDANFVVESIIEPLPEKNTERLYPKPWKYPRFLAMRCRRI